MKRSINFGLLLFLLFLAFGVSAQTAAVYQTIFPGAGVSFSDNVELNDRSNYLDSILTANTQEKFAVFSSSDYLVTANGNSGYDYLEDLIIEANSLSTNYVLLWWPAIADGYYDHLEVTLNLSALQGLLCLESVQFEALQAQLNQEAKMIIEAAPTGSFASLEAHATVEAQILSSLTGRLQDFVACCLSGTQCVSCLKSTDISNLQPLSSFERIYSESGTSQILPEVKAVSGSNYSISVVDSVTVSWGNTNKPLIEVVQDYLEQHAQEITWKVLITGKEVCNTNDQAFVSSFFDEQPLAFKPSIGDGEAKSQSIQEEHKLYVYLDEENKVRSKVSTTGDFYHPVDFKIEKLTRLGPRGYPTLGIHPSTDFIGPVNGTPSHFAGYTPSGSLINLPFGAVVGFYPSDGEENRENRTWPEGSIGAFQTGNRVFWGAWDDERNKFLGYVCKEAISFGDFCDPEPNPTYYLPKERDENDEPFNISTVVAAKTGWPDTCHIYGMSRSFTPEDRNNLHVNVNREDVDLADEIVRSLNVPQGAYNPVGIMPSAICLGSNEAYCRQILLEGHPYLEGNHPLARVLANNPCLVTDFEHVNFQISLGIDEEMEALKDIIAIAIAAPLLAAGFEIIAAEQAGTTTIRALAELRHLTRIAHNYIRAKVGNAASRRLIREAGDEFAKGALVDFAIQGLILHYTLPYDSTENRGVTILNKLSIPSALVAGASNAIAPVDESLLSRFTVALGDGIFNCAFNGYYERDGTTLAEEFNNSACLRGLGVAFVIRFALPGQSANQLQGLTRPQAVRLISQLSADAVDDFSELAVKQSETVNGVSWDWVKHIWDQIAQFFPTNSVSEAYERNLQANMDLYIKPEYLDGRRAIDALQEKATEKYDEAIAVIFGQDQAVFKRFMENGGEKFKAFCDDFAGNDSEIVDIIAKIYDGRISVRSWEVLYGHPLLRGNGDHLETVSKYLDDNPSISATTLASQIPNAENLAKVWLRRVDGERIPLTHMNPSSVGQGGGTVVFQLQDDLGNNVGQFKRYPGAGGDNFQYFYTDYVGGNGLIRNQQYGLGPTLEPTFSLSPDYIINPTGGNVLYGDLQLPILVNQNVKGLGELVFNDAFEYFNNSQGVDGIYGLWLADDVLYADYGGLSLNLSRFIDAVNAENSLEEAAFETITGQWAASKGFNNVDFLLLQPTNPLPGQGYTQVDVTFRR